MVAEEAITSPVPQFPDLIPTTADFVAFALDQRARNEGRALTDFPDARRVDRANALLTAYLATARPVDRIALVQAVVDWPQEALLTGYAVGYGEAEAETLAVRADLTAAVAAWQRAADDRADELAELGARCAEAEAGRDQALILHAEQAETIARQADELAAWRRRALVAEARRRQPGPLMALWAAVCLAWGWLVAGLAWLGRDERGGWQL